jgi:uncharacterized protein
MRREELELKTKDELLELARKLDIPRRSLLSKDGLIKALVRHGLKGRPPVFTPSRAVPPKPASLKSASPKTASRKPAQGRPATSKPAPPKAASLKAPSPKPASRTPAPRVAASPRPAVRKPAPPTAASPRLALRKPGPPKSAPKPVAPKPAMPKPVPRARVAVKTSSSRPARRVPAPQSTVAERGGPFGPASEQLHGGALAPTAGQAQGNGRPSPRSPLGSPLAMPDRYGSDHAALMVRDPYWLHAYWEVTPETLETARRELGDEWRDHRLVMRVFGFASEGEAVRDEERADRYDIELPSSATNWYLNVGRPDRAYRIVVGILTRTGRFRALVRSNDVRTPRDGYSPVTDEEWTTPAAAFPHLYEGATANLRDGRSSAELGLLLRERLAADWSSGMLGSMGSGAFARPGEGQGGFWFVVDAELIVYGATEPDARVTVQGRPLTLRPDGTFSLRFLLPDGTQVIDATAVSADGVFRRTITPTVRRETHVTEMIRNGAES